MRKDYTHYPTDWVDAQLATLAERDPAQLLPMLRNVSDSTRAAVRALGKAKSRAALPDLMGLATHEDYFTRHDALDALEMIDPNWPVSKRARTAVPLFQATLRTSRDARARADVAAILGRLGDVRAVDDLLAALKTEDSLLKCRAVEALGRLHATEALEPIIEALKSGDDSLRRTAAQALGHIGDARAIESLGAALSGLACAEAAEALSRFGGDGLDLMLARLRQVRPDSRESGNICAALRSFGTAAVPPLIQMLKDSAPDARAAAAYALGYSGDPPLAAASALCEALLDSDCHVRGYAEQTISWYRGAAARSAAEPIIRAWMKRGWASAETIKKMQLRDWRVIDPVLKGFVPTPVNLQVDMPLPGINPNVTSIKEVLLSLVPVSALTPNVATWVCEVPVFTRGSSSLSLDTSDNAIRNLCAVNTPVTSNVLHLVLEKKDFTTTFSDDSGYPDRDILISFEHQREAARLELLKRGNPPYDPERYRK